MTGEHRRSQHHRTTSKQGQSCNILERKGKAWKLFLGNAIPSQGSMHGDPQHIKVIVSQTGTQGRKLKRYRHGHSASPGTLSGCSSSPSPLSCCCPNSKGRHSKTLPHTQSHYDACQAVGTQFPPLFGAGNRGRGDPSDGTTSLSSGCE